jgi:ubiquinone/menaquinone biosynthesis C-methylase UbiE
VSNSSIYQGEKHERATSTDSLDTRLEINTAYASADFSGWLFERLAVQPGEDVLDVGCGNGAQSVPFSEIVGPEGSVSALDISESSVAELKAKVPAGAPLEAVAADMADLGGIIAGTFRVKTYDLAHSSYALYYSKDRNQVLDTMRHALKPGGRCAVFSPCSPHGLVEFAARFHPVPDEIWDCFEFGPDVLKPYFDANFDDVAIHRFHNELRIPDAATLMRFYEATTYYDADHAGEIEAEVERIVAENGCFEYEKNGYLIIGK